MAPTAVALTVSAALGYGLYTMDSEIDLFGLVGRRIAGKYDVECVVARGGFGLVYQGLHRSLKKRIAIKVLIVPEEFNDKARETFMQVFLREAETIAQLRHPAVVQVLDSGVDAMPAGTVAPWMVLEWIDGETLDDHLRRRQGYGGRPPEEVLTILRPVLEALAYAHDQGIAHRDIKPANMMLPAQTPRQSRHGMPSIQLLDFGIAKVMDPNEQSGSGATQTLSRHRAFSPPYAAPEQVGGSRTGPWTDVHAMGLILSEMLTDQPPFKGREQTELFIQVLSPHRPTPGTLGVDAGAWEAVIAKSLSLLPRDRFQTAGEFLAALEENTPNLYPRYAPNVVASVPMAPFIPPFGAVPPTIETFNPSTLSAVEAPTIPVTSRTPGRKRAAIVGALGAFAVLAVPLFLWMDRRTAVSTRSPVMHLAPPVTALPTLAVATPPVAEPAPVIVPVVAPTPVFAPTSPAMILPTTPTVVAVPSTPGARPARAVRVTVAPQPRPARPAVPHPGRRSGGPNVETPLPWPAVMPARRAMPSTPPTTPASTTPGLRRGDL